MSQARFIVGDVFEELAKLPDASVDLILTSPPFLALRSYLPSDHPDKAKEIGSEPLFRRAVNTLRGDRMSEQNADYVRPRHPVTGRWLAFDCERDCLEHCAGLCGNLAFATPAQIDGSGASS